MEANDVFSWAALWHFLVICVRVSHRTTQICARMRFMTRCLIAFLLYSAIAFTACSNAPNPGITKQDAPPFRTESSAHIVEGENSRTYVTENSSFQFIEVLGDTGDYEAVLLLEGSYHNENTPGIEGMRGDASIKAWTIRRGRQRELRWTAHEKANEGEIRSRFLRMTAWGCCDTPNTFTHYNLLSGKKLYVTNSELLEVRGQGEGPLIFRYLGFGYDATIHPGPTPQLQYGTDKDFIQKFYLQYPNDFYENPEVFVSAGNKLEKSLDLSSSPMSFVIVLRFLGDVELRIPVENDAIRLDKAKLPQGFLFRQDK